MNIFIKVNTNENICYKVKREKGILFEEIHWPFNNQQNLNFKQHADNMAYRMNLSLFGYVSDGHLCSLWKSL